VRKRLAIVGRSEEGLALIPLLEANPDVEILAIVTRDATATAQALERLDPALAARYADRVRADLEPVLAAPGLHAVIDADAPADLRDALSRLPERGVQVTTPLVAKLLFAFGPVDATRKPDLLQALSEVLESYDLTTDRVTLLDRVLQIAVGATGADRGSLMLYHADQGRLRVEAAIGLERELFPRIALAPGEGVAGRVFEERTARLLHGKADPSAFRIVRERDDVESAILAPLLHGEHTLGVLSVSSRRRGRAFGAEDLAFVEQLARVEARILARAEEYHGLLHETARLRAEAEVRRLLAASEPLGARLARICRLIADELPGGICQLWLHDAELEVLRLQASSTWLDPLGSRTRVRPTEGVLGWAARTRKPVLAVQPADGARVCFAVLPLVGRDTLLGVLSFEGAQAGSWPELLPERLRSAAEALGSGLADALRELRMEREATQMSAVAEVAARLTTSADSAELYRAIASAAAMVLEAEHALLRLQDEASGRFVIRAYFGSAETDSQAPLFELDRELSARALRQRSPLRVPDLAESPELAALGAEVSCALVHPLLREGRPFGTLSVLGKAAREALAPESFGADDQKVLAHLAEHAQRALELVLERERTRHRQRFDDLTGLANAAHLRERIDEEIARAAGRSHGFALVRVRFAGLAELFAEQEGSEVDRLLLSLVSELRGGLRDFDVLARTGPDEFHILLPEPEGEVQALLGPLARRAREALRREPDASLAERISLEFGYALFPAEGQTPKALLERARPARIRSL
jgi:GAF domain-containing protein